MAFSMLLAKRPRAEIDERRRQGGVDPRPHRPSRSLSAPALRRATPARGDGPGHRARPAGVPLRRAALEPRREAARGDAHGTEGAAPAPGDHLDLRDPRPDRSHDHGRPDRGDEGRGRGTARQAPGALRPAGEPLRRGLHRVSRDEFPAGALPQRGGRAARGAGRWDKPAHAGQGARHGRPAGDPRHTSRAPRARRRCARLRRLGRGSGADRRRYASVRESSARRRGHGGLPRAPRFSSGRSDSPRPGSGTHACVRCADWQVVASGPMQ